MTHVSLDGVDEPVRRFLLALVADPAGSILELGGRPVARIVPTSPPAEEDVWTEAKNQRRCDLIGRKYKGGLTPAEADELARLQEQALEYQERVAPLPLEAVRRLHQELVDLAAAKPAMDR